MAQLPELIGHGTTVYAMTAAGLAIIYGLPYLTKAVPSPLVTIILLTAVSIYFGFGVHKVGDMGALPSELPWIAIPQVPLNLDPEYHSACVVDAHHTRPAGKSDDGGYR
jgi:SulP family sulfate permease